MAYVVMAHVAMASTHSSRRESCGSHTPAVASVTQAVPAAHRARRVRGAALPLAELAVVPTVAHAAALHALPVARARRPVRSWRAYLRPRARRSTAARIYFWNDLSGGAEGPGQNPRVASGKVSGVRRVVRHLQLGRCRRRSPSACAEAPKKMLLR